MTSAYPNGFTSGLTVRGLPITIAHPGEVFFVNNSSVLAKGGVSGSNGNDGSYKKPWSTIEGALNNGAVKAGRGDIILVMPGHAETITTATDLVLDKSGVAIIGLGTGALRPTLTFATNATANIPITAANMSVKNILFVANKADVASVFTATSTNTPKDLAIEDCEFRDTSSILNFMTIVTGNATANSMDGLYFANNRISSLGTTAATTAIKLLEATKRVQIMDNFGVWAVLNDTAAMLAGSTFNHTDFQFARNVLNRPNTSSTDGSFISGSGTTWTGVAHNNLMWQLDNSAGIWIPTGTKLGFFENYSPITGAADKSGLINPVAV
jgi:hypothetical protein